MFNTNCYGNESIPSYTQGVESPWSAHNTHNSQGLFHQHPVAGNTNAFVGYGVGQVQSKELDLAGVVGMKEPAGAASTSAASNAWHHSHRMRYSSAAAAAATASRGFLPYQMSSLPHYDSQSVDTSHLASGTHHQPFWVTNPNAYSIMGSSYQRDHNAYAERGDTSRNTAAIRHNTVMPNRNYTVEDQTRNVNASLQQQPAQGLSQHCQRQSRHQLQQHQHQQLHHQQDYLRNQMSQRERNPCQYTSSSYHQEGMRVGLDPTLYHEQHVIPSTQQHHQQCQASQEALRKAASENERRTAFTSREAWAQTWAKSAYVPFDSSQTFLSNHRSTGSAFQPCSKQTDSDPYSMDSIWAKSAVPTPSPHATNHAIPPTNNQMPLSTQSWVHDTSHLKSNVYRPPQQVNQMTNVPSNFSTNVLNLDTGQVELSMSVVPPELSLYPQAVSQTQRHRPPTSHSAAMPVQPPLRSLHAPVVSPSVVKEPPPKPVELSKPSSTARAAGLDVRQFLATWDEDLDLATPRPAIVEVDESEPEPPEQPSLVVLDYQNVPSEEAAGLLEMYPGLQLSGNDPVVLLDNTAAKANLDFVLSRAVPTTMSSASGSESVSDVNVSQPSAINVVHSPASVSVSAASTVPEKPSINHESSPCDASKSTNSRENLVEVSSQPCSQEPTTPASLCESDSEKSKKSSLRLFRKRKVASMESDASSQCSEPTEEIPAKNYKSDDYNNMSNWFGNDSMDTIDGPVRTPVSVSSAACDSTAQSPTDPKDSEAKSSRPWNTESTTVSVITMNHHVTEKTGKSMPDISDSGIFASAERQTCESVETNRELSSDVLKEPDNSQGRNNTKEKKPYDVSIWQLSGNPDEEASVRDMSPCENVQRQSCDDLQQKSPDKTEVKVSDVQTNLSDKEPCFRNNEGSGDIVDEDSCSPDNGESSSNVDREICGKMDDESCDQTETEHPDKPEEKSDHQPDDVPDEEPCAMAEREPRDIADREFCDFIDRELCDFRDQEQRDLTEQEPSDLTGRESLDLTRQEPHGLTDGEPRGFTDEEPRSFTGEEARGFTGEEARSFADKEPRGFTEEPRGFADEESRGFTDGERRGFTDGEPRGFTGGEPRGFTDDEPRGFTDDEPRGFTDGEPRGFTDEEPRGFTDKEPRGFTDEEPRGFPDGEPLGFTDGEPRGFRDEEPHGFTDKEPRGFTDKETCGFTDGEPRGFTDKEPRGFTDKEPRGFTDEEPRGLTGEKPRGFADVEPHGFTDKEPSGFADQKSCGFADQASPGFGDQEPRGYADKEPPAFADKEPRGFTDEEPRGLTDEEPRGFADVEPRGFTDKEPRGFADQKPCGFADQAYPAFGDQAHRGYADTDPPGFADRDPRRLANRKLRGSADQEPHGFADREPRDVADRELRDLIGREHYNPRDQEPRDFTDREPLNITDREPRDTTDWEPRDITDPESYTRTDLESRDITDREPRDIAAQLPDDIANQESSKTTIWEPSDIVNPNPGNSTEGEPSDATNQHPNDNRDIDDVMDLSQYRGESHGSIKEPLSTTEQEIEKFPLSPDPEPNEEPLRSGSDMKSSEPQEILRKSKPIFLENRSDDASISAPVSPRKAPEDSQETTKYLSRIVGSAPGKIPKILLSRLKDVRDKTRRKNGVVRKLPSIRLRRVRSGEEPPEYVCREQDRQPDFSVDNEEPREDVLKTESAVGLDSDVRSDGDCFESKQRSRNVSPVSEKNFEDICERTEEVSPKNKCLLEKESAAQDLSLQNEEAGTQPCKSPRTEDTNSVAEPSCLDLIFSQGNESTEKETKTTPVSPFEMRLSSGQLFRNKSPDSADRWTDHFTRRESGLPRYVRAMRSGSTSPRYFEKDIISGQKYVEDLHKSIEGEIYKLKSPPVRNHHSFREVADVSKSRSEEKTLETKEDRLETVERRNENTDWATDEDSCNSLWETSKQSPQAPKGMDLNESSCCSCDAPKTSEPEKYSKKEDSGHSDDGSSDKRSVCSSLKSRSSSRPRKASKERDSSSDEDDDTSDSSDKSSVCSSGTSTGSSSSESDSSESSESSDESSSEDEKDDKASSNDENDNDKTRDEEVDGAVSHQDERKETCAGEDDVFEKECLSESSKEDGELTPVRESGSLEYVNACGLNGEPVVEKTEHLPETAISNSPAIEPVAKTYSSEDDLTAKIDEQCEAAAPLSNGDATGNLFSSQEDKIEDVLKMDQVPDCSVVNPVVTEPAIPETKMPCLDRASVPDNTSAHNEKTDSPEFLDHVELIDGTEVVVENDTLLMFADEDAEQVFVEEEDGIIQVENTEEFHIVVDEEQYKGLCNGTMEVYSSDALKRFTVENIEEVQMCEEVSEEVHSSHPDQENQSCDEVSSTPVEEVVDNGCDIGREEVCSSWREGIEVMDDVPLPVGSVQNWPYSEEDVPLQVKCSVSWDRILNEGQGLVLGPANVEVRVPGEEAKKHTHWKVVTRERKRAGTSKNRSCFEENNNVMLDVKSPIVVVKKLVLKRPRTRRSLKKREEDTLERIWEETPKITPLKTKAALKAFQAQTDVGLRSRHQSWPPPSEDVGGHSDLKRRKSELCPSAQNWNCSSPQRLPKVIIKRTGPQYQSFICENNVIMQPVVSIERNAELDNLAINMWSEIPSPVSSGGQHVDSSELNGTVRRRIRDPSKVSRTGQLMKVVELLQQWRQAEQDEASKGLGLECADTIENNNSLLCVDNNADDEKYLCQFHSPESACSIYSRVSRDSSVTNDSSYNKSADVENVEESQDGTSDVEKEKVDDVEDKVEELEQCNVFQDLEEVVKDVAQEDIVKDGILEESIREDETVVQEVEEEFSLQERIVQDHVLENDAVKENGVAEDSVEMYTEVVESSTVQESDSLQGMQEADSAIEESIADGTVNVLQEKIVVQEADSILEEDVYEEEIQKDVDISRTEKESLEGNAVEESPEQSRRTSLEEELGLPLVCQVCGFTTTRLEEQANHIKTHSYHCQRCQLAFLSHEDFKDHLAAEHPTIEELHHCLLCQRTFPTAERQAQHKKGWHHNQMERSQRHTIHSLFRLFTGNECPYLPSLSPEEAQAFDWLPSDPGIIHFYHDATPLQLAIQDCEGAKEDAESC